MWASLSKLAPLPRDTQVCADCFVRGLLCARTALCTDCFVYGLLCFLLCELLLLWTMDCVVCTALRGSGARLLGRQPKLETTNHQPKFKPIRIRIRNQRSTARTSTPPRTRASRSPSTRATRRCRSARRRSTRRAPRCVVYCVCVCACALLLLPPPPPRPRTNAATNSPHKTRRAAHNNQNNTERPTGRGDRAVAVRGRNGCQPFLEAA